MRVIAGKHKNRTLRASNQFRPTSDRVRETLFNILQTEIQDAVFVDAFAGSGAVGIEAISRGASMVYFLETNRKALQALEWNLASCCNQDRWRIFTVDALKGLDLVRNAEPVVDQLFFDPPYQYQKYKELLLLCGQMFPEATYIVETSTRVRVSVPELLQEVKHRKIGETMLSFYRVK